MTNKTAHEPLFQISKRTEMPFWKSALVRAIAIIGGLFLICCVCGIIFSANPFYVLFSILEGALGSEKKLLEVLQLTALLLLVGLALLPAFKMKFWNLGATGQIYAGAIVTAFIMNSNFAQTNSFFVKILMVVCAVLAGALWAVIPAVFKAFFNTNESLFTLMMNYIAVGLVPYFSDILKGSSTVPGNPSFENAHFLEYFGKTQYNQTFPSVIFAVVITAFMFLYIKYSKHGYEIGVVGESEKTAKYAGMNVKKVLIRTMALSGAICGLVGLLLVGTMQHGINDTMENGMGFTAIMVAWLGKMNPLWMIATSFLVAFLTKGVEKSMQNNFNQTESSIMNVSVAIVYFLLIACEFFIVYKVKITRKKSKSELDFLQVQSESKTVEEIEEKK